MKFVFMKLGILIGLMLFNVEAFAEFALPDDVEGSDDSVDMIKNLANLAVPLAVGVVMVIGVFLNMNLILEALGEYKKTRDIKAFFGSVGVTLITLILIAVMAGFIAGFLREYFV